jgi:hypothetical protein
LDGQNAGGTATPPRRPGCSRFIIFLVPRARHHCSRASAAQGMIPDVYFLLGSNSARWDYSYEDHRLGAIVYSVHDAHTFGALVLLIAGEIAVSYVSHRRSSPRRRLLS